MAVIHISEQDAARDFAGLLQQVRHGAEFVIDDGELPVALLRPTASPKLTLRERIALLPENSDAIMDDDFARDIQAAIDAFRAPLHSPENDPWA